MIETALVGSQLVGSCATTLYAGILRHHVGEAAGAVGVEALAEQALQVGDLALDLAVVLAP